MAAAKREFFHALTINTEVCVGCAHCMKKCPTGAIRIHGGKASIRKDWCIDCGECMKVCPRVAIYVAQNDFDNVFDYSCRVALVPAIFFGQFAETDTEQDIMAALYTLGFTHVCHVEYTVDIIHEETASYIAEATEKPVISSYCPAIVRLIQTRFPDLVDNIINVKPPVEASAMLFRQKLLEEGVNDKDIGIFYVTPCAAKIASFRDNPESSSLIDGVLNMDFLYNKVCQVLRNKPAGFGSGVKSPPVLSSTEMSWGQTSGEADNYWGRCFAVDEIHNVIEFIESLELTGEINDIDFLELRACDRGCVGGVLTPANRFLAGERLHRRSEQHPPETVVYDTFSPSAIGYLKAHIENEKFAPKTKLLYKGNINQVLKQMDSANQIVDILPGIDCGACGSPNCLSLAEDIVRGEAAMTNCIFRQRELEQNGMMSYHRAHTILEEVWGKERMNKNKRK